MDRFWIRHILYFCVIFLFFAQGIGCATHADRLRAARLSYYSGNVLTAKEKLDTEIKKAKTKEKDVFKLDQAIIDLFSGDVEKANKTLREVRNSFDHLEQKNVAEDALSMLTDENAVAYSGEDYEKIMIRVLLTLTDLLNNGEDAVAYSTQINLKQEEIIRKGVGKIKNPDNPEEIMNPKLAYKYLAIGPYLRGLIQEETWTNYDDAVRSYQQVLQLAPDFGQAQTDLQRATHGRHSFEGNGVVYVFSFVGKGPFKEKATSAETQIGLLIADQIFSATNKYSVPPTIAPVPIPKVVAPYNRIDAVNVEVDNRLVGTTETITDISQLALDQYEATKNVIIARAIVRRIVKKGAVYGAKQVGDVNPWISLAMDLGGIVWEASETADTRCWGLLPAKIQVLRVELPEGTHEISLCPKMRFGSPSSVKETQTIQVRRGRNTYVLSNFTEERLIGKIIVR